MKKLNQHILLAAMAMLTAGVANAQVGGPTNQLSHTPAAPVAPNAPQGPNNNTIQMGGTGYSRDRNSYVQDSYVEQTSTNNYANVTQVDNRTGTARTNGAGSSASIVQTGSYNDAYQTQTLDATSTPPGSYRNEVGAVQRGDHDKSTQTQNGGYYNTARVTQEAGSTYSQATQTQTGGHDNSASITQSKFGGDPNDNNTATQTQTGGNDNAAAIRQQGHSGVAMQTQTGSFNSAAINQGARGANNTAIQDQSGTDNKARITQSVNYPQADFDYNFARQTQSGSSNSADINQRANHSYAEQVQSGTDNRSLITQGADLGTGNAASYSNVASAAYTTQSGTSNSVTISQR